MKIIGWESPEIGEEVIDKKKELDSFGSNIIIFNDDVNSFDWVIQSLVEICSHTKEQAEQCALIIHTRGKCGVKKGTFEKLRPLAEGLIDRGINATIE